MHKVTPTSSTSPAQPSTSGGIPPAEIQILPPEIMLRIFKELPSLTALKARTVCSGWNVLLTDNLLWKGFFARDFPGRASGLPTNTLYQEAYIKTHTAILYSPLGKGMCEQRLLTLGYNCRVNAFVTIDGKLFSATMADTINVWDLETDTRLKVLEGHDDGVTSLHSCDNGQLISTSFDRTIRVWNIEENTSGYEEGEDPFTSICHAGAKLFFGDMRGNIISCDLKESISDILPKRDTDEEITCLAFGNDKLCIGSTGNRIEIWDTKNCCYLKPLSGHQERVTSLICNNDGVLFSGSFDGTIKIWDIERGVCLRTYKGNAEQVTSLIFADGFLISGHNDGTIRIWNLVTRTCLHTFEAPNELQERLHSVASLHYKKGVLFAGYECGAIAIFDFNKSTASKETEEQEKAL